MGRKRQSVVFRELLPKPVMVEFTNPGQTSDGGVILLKALDERLGLTRNMAQAIKEPRQLSKIQHQREEILRERIYGMACGYSDGNDAARLGNDPLLQQVCVVAEQPAEQLASQPTISRFENSLRRTDLLRVALAQTETVLQAERRRRYGRRVHKITIDMDPTDDPTYGGQQLTFFNKHYDNYCYLPMITTLQFDGERDEVLVAPVLRPGNAPGTLGALGILRRLLPRLRHYFPFAQLHVRMDGAFAAPEIYDFLDGEDLIYHINQGKNSVLLKLAEPLLVRARQRAARTGQTARFFGSARYQAKKWARERRVIIKAEVTVLPGREPRDNPRFVVTNQPGSAKENYRCYCQRGNMENRIKELDAVGFNLTSCTSFRANQLRNLLSGAAYILCQQLRREVPDPQLKSCQVWTLRERLFKIGMNVRESVRRLLLEGPAAYPWQNLWRLLALRLGASP